MAKHPKTEQATKSGSKEILENIQKQASVEMAEFQEEYKKLCEKYNCRIEAQITLNSKGMNTQTIIVHNLMN